MLANIPTLGAGGGATAFGGRRGQFQLRLRRIQLHHLGRFDLRLGRLNLGGLDLCDFNLGRRRDNLDLGDDRRGRLGRLNGEDKSFGRRIFLTTTWWWIAPMISSRMRMVTFVTMLVAKDPQRFLSSTNRPKFVLTEMRSVGICSLLG